jgi:hypothetical protein
MALVAERPQDRTICWWKPIPGHFARRHPANLVARKRPRFSSADRTAKDMELHYVLRIRMPDDTKRHRGRDGNPQLLSQFPPEALTQRFARLALPAWKLPKSTPRHVRLPLRNQVAVATPNKPSRNPDHPGWATHSVPPRLRPALLVHTCPLAHQIPRSSGLGHNG